MLTATLLTSPAAPSLDPARVAALARAWGATATRWLAPGEACDLDLPEPPPADAWQTLQAEATDLLVQPAAGRARKLLLADMDSTMIGQECIDELAHEAGVGPRVAAITARAMNGELDFEAALRERVALLRGLPESTIAHVLRTRITPAPGAATLLATLRARGTHAFLVSGGFSSFAGPVARALGFHDSRANVLLADAGTLTGTVADPVLGREAKVETLNALCARLGLDPSQALAVGDGANDLGMLAAAGAGVALHAKPAVQAQAKLVVNHGDLTALLYLQGIAREAFVAAPDPAFA